MSASPNLAVPLESIASCFEGVVPSTICSCDTEGMPNLTFLSIVHRIDSEHVGLSYQFFNKTRKNIVVNPQVQVVVVSPETAQQFRLDLHYERTDTEGAAFDRMKGRLAAVASQTGMSQVFHLLGVDVYRVLDCRPLNEKVRVETLPKAGYLSELETFTERLAACGDLNSLIETALDSFSSLFNYPHSFVMAPDEDGTRLFTVASHGYPKSGAGSEVRMGEGLLGIAAERRIVVRSTNVTFDTLMSRAVRSEIERSGEHNKIEKEIALPGLPEVRSQIVAPLLANNELLGVICLQSTDAGRFLADDERLVQIAARHLAASMAMLRHADTLGADPAPSPPSPVPSAVTSTIKHYEADDSIFIDDVYLIKGIAGRIFWKLLEEHQRNGRVEFTNRGIRLDASMQLPDFKDNLETRLILLRRRLKDQCRFVSLESSGRGRFRLEMQRRLKLEKL
jgi:adenylate cyclase